MPEKAYKHSELPEDASLYVCKMNDFQRMKLEEILKDRGWEFSSAPHAHWKAILGNMNVTAYVSGKVVAQGKGVGELALYTIEPEITGEPILGYEDFGKEEEKKPFIAHAGVDESGKGDLFGPLSVASVFVDEDSAVLLQKLGVKDSKQIKSDAKIVFLAKKIMGIVKGNFSIVSIGPEAYNRLYQNFGNLNRLLAWGHSRAIENILEKVQKINYVLSDKFGNENLIKNALMKKGREVELRQEVKAESDIAVAAASVLARNAFLEGLKNLSEKSGHKLPKGCSENAKDILKQIYNEKGVEFLPCIAKMHFKTVTELLNAPDSEDTIITTESK